MIVLKCYNEFINPGRKIPARKLSFLVGNLYLSHHRARLFFNRKKQITASYPNDVFETIRWELLELNYGI